MIVKSDESDDVRTFIHAKLFQSQKR